MITSDEMIAKVGKKKFADIVTHSQRGETGAQRQKRKRWGKGTTLFAICKHDKVTVRDGEPTKECKACLGDHNTNLKEFTPYFNIGLGCWVESRQDERRAARSMGLQEAG